MLNLSWIHSIGLFVGQSHEVEERSFSSLFPIDGLLEKKRSNGLAQILFLGAVVCLLGFISQGFAKSESISDVSAKPVFTILYTAESHAALLPCDCPLVPLGGVSRRAALIKTYRSRGPVLLVDGGGWAAGGMYDENSDGDIKRDQLRTVLMAKSMAAMEYDAVGWGRAEWDASLIGSDLNTPNNLVPFEELANVMVRPITTDLQGGSLETLKGGLFAGRTFRKRIRKELNGIRVDVSSLVPDFIHRAQSLKYEKQAVQKLHKETNGGDFKILINPSGEESSERIAGFEAANGVNIILNAGRKVTQRTAWRVHNTTIVNFNFQVQAVLVIEVYKRSDKETPWKISVKEEALAPSMPGNKQMDSFISTYRKTLIKKGKQKVELEYWMMAECPYCKDVHGTIKSVSMEYQERLHLVPHFLVGKNEEGELTALHGEAELQETKILALIWEYFPEKFWRYLDWRERSENEGKSWTAGAQALGILKARIKGALALGKADTILEQDYQRSRRRKIQGTPSLVLSNRIYNGSIKRLDLMRVICGMLEAPKPEICASVPVCTLDIQCKKRGYVGVCLEKGLPKARCDYSKVAVAVEAVVLMDKDAIWSNYEKILSVLLDYLPGLSWRFVAPASVEGQELIGKYKIVRFPSYLIGLEAKKEVNYKQNLGGIVIETEDGLLLSANTTGAHQLGTRKRIRGRADLFVSRFSTFGQQAVTVALDVLKNSSEPPNLEIRDALFWRRTTQASNRELAAQGGISEIEEAAIGLAVQELYPNKWLSYLKARSKRRASMYWDRALVECEIDVKAVRAIAEEPAPRILKRMHETADLLKEISGGGKVILLAENCEVIPLNSRKELAYYLERIGQRVNPRPVLKVESKP